MLEQLHYKLQNRIWQCPIGDGPGRHVHLELKYNLREKDHYYYVYVILASYHSCPFTCSSTFTYPRFEVPDHSGEPAPMDQKRALLWQWGGFNSYRFHVSLLEWVLCTTFLSALCSVLPSEARLRFQHLACEELYVKAIGYIVPVANSCILPLPAIEEPNHGGKKSKDS